MFRSLAISLALTLFLLGFGIGLAVAPSDVEQGDLIQFGGTIPPVRLDTASLMRLFNAPGFSVAVIEDWKISWAKGYGVTEMGGLVPVTPRTLFLAGSISKPVAAVGSMTLVQNGTLNLDEDVNDKLTTWRVPENQFTAKNKVTLRRILSHTAGMTVHGFDGYSRGSVTPTLTQILDGTPPATNDPVRVDVEPGTIWRYSGGAAEVEQQLVQDVTHEPFARFASHAVLERFHMVDSTFEEPLPTPKTPLAAHGTYYDGKGVAGGWEVIPQQVAAGLWTTPTDLARFAIAIALSKNGRSNSVLNQATATLMLSPQVDKVEEVALGNGEHPDRMGLGFFLGDRTRPDLFGHIGDDPGFQAMLEMYSDSGKGIAIMGNSENTIVLGDYFIEHVAEQYKWPNFVLPDRFRIGVGEALALVALRSDIQTAFGAYGELKRHATLNGPRYPITQNTLIHFAYAMQRLSRPHDAVEVASLEAKEYPLYWNAFDTLGEMDADAGDKARAIAAYKRAIQLNPQSQGSKDALAKLEQSPP